MTFPILAQAAVDHGGVLLTYGPMGIVLAWFMFRAERFAGEVRSLAHRIDGLTRALLMDMVDRDSTGDKTKLVARAEIAKIEERLNKRAE